MCVTEEQPGGLDAPAGPARLRKAPSRRLCIQRLREGLGHADLGGSHEAGVGEECSVPEVKPSGGKILRRGG